MKLSRTGYTSIQSVNFTMQEVMSALVVVHAIESKVSIGCYNSQIEHALILQRDGMTLPTYRYKITFECMTNLARELQLTFQWRLCHIKYVQHRLVWLGVKDTPSAFVPGYRCHTITNMIKDI